MSASPRWPTLEWEERRWVPDPVARGNRADRTLGTYRSALVPLIAARTPHVSSATGAVLAAAQEAVAGLRTGVGTDLAAMTGALLRSESVASSKIEHLTARQDEVGLAVFDIARGLGASGVPATARSVAANVVAMTRAVDSPPGEPLTVPAVLDMHRLLLREDPVNAREAGKTRAVQNWIGGSDHSPRGALFVPPAAEHVPRLLDDVIAFANRRDLPAVLLAAVTHAQFETIHPFTDGNGRTGRALIHTLWRRIGFTGPTVIPVSTVLLADVEGYFAGLDEYRAGDIDAWVARFAAATVRAALAGQRLADRVEQLRRDWAAIVRPRAGSAVAALIEVALRQPVLDIDALRAAVPGTDRNRYLAVDRLAARDLLVEITGQGRNRIWIAPDVFALLERFEADLGHRTPPTP